MIKLVLAHVQHVSRIRFCSWALKFFYISGRMRCHRWRQTNKASFTIKRDVKFIKRSIIWTATFRVAWIYQHSAPPPPLPMKFKTLHANRRNEFPRCVAYISGDKFVGVGWNRFWSHRTMSRFDLFWQLMSHVSKIFKTKQMSLKSRRNHRGNCIIQEQTEAN